MVTDDVELISQPQKKPWFGDQLLRQFQPGEEYKKDRILNVLHSIVPESESFLLRFAYTPKRLFKKGLNHSIFCSEEIWKKQQDGHTTYLVCDRVVGIDKTKNGMYTVSPYIINVEEVTLPDLETLIN